MNPLHLLPLALLYTAHAEQAPHARSPQQQLVRQYNRAFYDELSGSRTKQRLLNQYYTQQRRKRALPSQIRAIQSLLAETKHLHGDSLYTYARENKLWHRLERLDAPQFDKHLQLQAQISDYRRRHQRYLVGEAYPDPPLRDMHAQLAEQYAALPQQLTRALEQKKKELHSSSFDLRQLRQHGIFYLQLLLYHHLNTKYPPEATAATKQPTASLTKQL